MCVGTEVGYPGQLRSAAGQEGPCDRLVSLPGCGAQGREQVGRCSQGLKLAHLRE